MRSDKDDQLSSLFAVGFRTEQRTHKGDSIQQWDSRHRGGGSLLDLAPNGDGVAVLHGHLSGDGLGCKRGRVNAASRGGSAGRSGGTDVLVDNHSDNTARRHPGYDIESYSLSLIHI